MIKILCVLYACVLYDDLPLVLLLSQLSNTIKSCAEPSSSAVSDVDVLTRSPGHSDNGFRKMAIQELLAVVVFEFNHY